MTYHSIQCPLTGQWQVMFNDGTRAHAVYDDRADAEAETLRRNAECLVRGVGDEAVLAPAITKLLRSQMAPAGGTTDAMLARPASGTFARTLDPSLTSGPGLRSAAALELGASTPLTGS